MAEKIKSLHEMMKKLTVMNAEFLVTGQEAIAKSCVKVQSTAKDKFGHYQAAVGPFPEWAQLAEITVKRKEEAGGAEDPLIGHYKASDHSHRAGGDLRKSILVEVKGLQGEVGTNDKLAPYHEYGTSRIPPRPYLRPALLQNENYIREQMIEAIAKAIALM